MIKFIRLKTDEYNHNDDQILKARVSHMIKGLFGLNLFLLKLKTL